MENVLNKKEIIEHSHTVQGFMTEFLEDSE